MPRSRKELTTREWIDVFSQARALGAVQLGLTGGEPVLRQDLPTLVEEAHGMGFYTNLITSAVGLTEKKLDTLVAKGLDSVQISFQAERRDLNAFIGGKDTFVQKQRMMHAVTARGLPLTLNVVVHRLNIDRIADICAFCDSMNPDHVEIASTQYHGWALKNAAALMPTPAQVERAREAVEAYQARAGGSSRIYYVLPDVIEKRAKPCQQGWGTTYLCVNPHGDVAPCLSAHTLPSLQPLPNVRDMTLAEVWERSDAFNRFRGDAVDWMDEGDVEARAHPRRAEDKGGCRCQAFALTGSETAMDPVCETATGHGAFLEWAKQQYDTVGTVPAPRRTTRQ